MTYEMADSITQVHRACTNWIPYPIRSKDHERSASNYRSVRCTLPRSLDGFGDRMRRKSICAKLRQSDVN